MRALKKLDPSTRPRVQGAIALLAQDPRPPASRPLRGRPGYRVRVGDYRIFYAVADDVLLVVVVTLGHRRGVYEHGLLPATPARGDQLKAPTWSKWCTSVQVTLQAPRGRTPRRGVESGTKSPLRHRVRAGTTLPALSSTSAPNLARSGAARRAAAIVPRPGPPGSCSGRGLKRRGDVNTTPAWCLPVLAHARTMRSKSFAFSVLADGRTPGNSSPLLPKTRPRQYLITRWSSPTVASHAGVP